VLTGLASVALLALGLVVLLPDCASACSCGGSGVPFQEVAKGDSSSAVFSGEVIDVEKGPQISRVTFRTSKVWKGKHQETQTVSTPSYGAACGYPFKEGKEYLVYAYWGRAGSPPRPTLMESACGPTVPLTEADANLRVLRNGATLGGSGAVLTDTSGGFPPLGGIGMVGGAVAVVSLAMLMRLVRTS
jgi:hypothetical protein